MAIKTKKEEKNSLNASIVAEGGTGRSTWSGAIMMAGGAIQIPVSLFSAARPEKIAFNQLHRTCNSQLKQAGMYCPCCVEVKALEDLVVGQFRFPQGRC